MANRYWQTATWRDDCEKYLVGKKCARCGSDQGLVVHHTHETQHVRDFLMRPIIGELMDAVMPKKEMDIPAFKCGFCAAVVDAPQNANRSATCPICKAINLFPGVPEQKISSAMLGHVVVDPAFLFTKHVSKRAYMDKETFKAFLKQHEQDLNRLAQERGIPVVPDYKDINQDTIPLCLECHCAVEKGTGIVILPSGLHVFDCGTYASTNRILLDLSNHPSKSKDAIPALEKARAALEEAYSRTDLELGKVNPARMYGEIEAGTGFLQAARQLCRGDCGAQATHRDQGLGRVPRIAPRPSPRSHRTPIRSWHRYRRAYSSTLGS